MELNINTKLIFYAAGILVCHSYFGVIHERITRSKYGKPGEEENFTHMISLVFIQCFINYVYANLLLRTFMPQSENSTKSFYVWGSALTNLLAMVCTNMSLLWINYPTQVIGKSAKPIPIMILGVIFGNKSYPLRKYLCVLFVVIGVAVFMYKDGKPSSNGDSAFGFGEILLMVSLIMDGLTGTIQERMRVEYKTKSLHMMSGMNKWIVIFLCAVVIITGELSEFILFVNRHRSILWELFSFSIACAQGQMFIFLMIEHFGPLACSIVTTIRKFFTVLFSIIFFGDSLLPRQWAGTSIVFSGLFIDSFSGKGHNSISKPQYI